MIGYVSALRRYIRAKNRQRLQARKNKRLRVEKKVVYADWIGGFDTLTGANREAVLQRFEALERKPLISVVMPVYNPDPEMLRGAIQSVKNQYYDRWELCIADDASTDPRVREVLESEAQGDERIRVVYRPRNGHISNCTNSAIEIAKGEYLGFLDQDDVLREHALVLVAEALNVWPEALCVYSDEDKLSELGERVEPHFKPDFNWELLLSSNYICHLCVLQTSLVRSVGGLRAGYEGSQDHDLLLRCLVDAQPEQVIHIPHILYHWRIHELSTAAGNGAKDYALSARIRAVQDILDTQGQRAQVESDRNGFCKIVWAPVDPAPSVLIVVPTRNGLELLSACLSSVFEKTDYPNYQVVVVDNGSDDPATLEYLEAQTWSEPRLRVVRDDRPFNFSALNNRAVSRFPSDYILLLNNDVEVITPGWLNEMVALGQRPGVGAVGARLWYSDGRLQHGGVILRGPEGVAGHANKFLPREHPGYMCRAMLLQSFSAVTAACLLVGRRQWDEVGGLNETHLTVAFNDVDFCLKLIEKGYRNVWTPHAELFHHESVSRGDEDTPEKKRRFLSEVTYMHERWGGLLCHDRAISPYFCNQHEDMRLAAVPRVSLTVPWFAVESSHSQEPETEPQALVA